MLKFIPPLIAMFLPITAFARSAPEKPMERIAWAVKYSGEMPNAMIVGLVLLIAMIIITILISFMKGDDKK